MSIQGRAGVGGALAMSFVGGSVAVSAGLAQAPFLTVQALRYAVAAALLIAICAMTGRRIRRPRGAEWLWLAGVTGCGLIFFNIALIIGGQHAEPAVLGVAVACVPVVLAAVGPLLEGSSPTTRAVVAAAVVTIGAALVEGFGRSDAIGLCWAVAVFACEAGFTLLAMPLFARHSPYGVSVHTTWMAALGFAALAVVREGPGAVLGLDAAALAATGFLAVFVTAAAFVLWYGCVARLGAARAGLLTGIAPVAAAVTGVALGHPFPGIGVWAGVAVVAMGLTLGLRTRRVVADAGRGSEAVETSPV